MRRQSLRRAALGAALGVLIVLLVPAVAQAHHVKSNAECVLVEGQPTLKLTADFYSFSSTHDVSGRITVDGEVKFDGPVAATWNADDDGVWVWTQPAIAGKSYVVETKWTWNTTYYEEQHETTACPEPPPPPAAPGIELTKTGPASGEVGQTVAYSFAVRNTGAVTLLLGDIADDKCIDTPVRNAGETDASFDPGDTFNFTCSYVVPAGAATVVNTATVCGTYTPPQGPPQEVCDTDDHSFPVPSTPPTNPPTGNPPTGNPPAGTPPAGTQPAVTPPAGGVLTETVLSGRARLSGPSGCITRTFRARVRGRSIARVRFFVDGKLVKTVRGTQRVYTVKVRPQRYGFGRHLVTVRVRFLAESGTPARTLRLTFSRCRQQVIAPRFTG